MSTSSTLVRIAALGGIVGAAAMLVVRWAFRPDDNDDEQRKEP